MSVEAFDQLSSAGVGKSRIMSTAPLRQSWRVVPHFRLVDGKSHARLRDGVACLKVHACVALATGICWIFLSASSALISSGCIVGATYLWLGITEVRRGPLWLTPLVAFFFFYAIEMGPAAIYVGYQLRAEPWLPFTNWMLPASDVATGYLVTILGMLAMHCGVEKLRPREESKGPSGFKAERFPYLSFAVLWCVGMVATLRPQAMIPAGMFGVVAHYGAVAALLPLAFATAPRLGISGLSHKVMFTIGTCGLVGVAAVGTDSKSEVLLALMPLGALLVHHKTYRKWVPLAVGCGLFCYLALLAPAINDSRNIPTVEGMTSWDKVVQAAETHSILTPGESTVDLLGEQSGNLMTRMFEAPVATGFMVGEVRRTGLQLGETMRTLEYAFIPRIVWPKKPNVSRGAWFTTYLGLAPRPQEATSSTGMTAFGEWYWNFGIFGELAGMFLVGILLGGLWRLVGSYPIFEPLKMLLYAAILVDSVMLPEASSVLVTMVALYALFGGAVFLRGIVDLRTIRLRVSHQSRF